MTQIGNVAMKSLSKTIASSTRSGASLNIAKNSASLKNHHLQQTSEGISTKSQSLNPIIQNVSERDPSILVESSLWKTGLQVPEDQPNEFAKYLRSFVLSSHLNKDLNISDSTSKSNLFPYRIGFGKSSNVDTMRPNKDWAFVHNINGLGQPQNRRFSTTTIHRNSKNGKECDKKGGALPCLKPWGFVKPDGAKVAGNNKICEKFCMPCCPPARDPPECIVPKARKECKKFKAPRPAYSECKKDAMKPIKPCECTIERLPACSLGDSADKPSTKSCK